MTSRSVQLFVSSTIVTVVMHIYISRRGQGIIIIIIGSLYTSLDIIIIHIGDFSPNQGYGKKNSKRKYLLISV